MIQFAAKHLSGHFLGWCRGWGAFDGDRRKEYVGSCYCIGCVRTFLVYVKVDELELQSPFF